MLCLWREKNGNQGSKTHNGQQPEEGTDKANTDVQWNPVSRHPPVRQCPPINPQIIFCGTFFIGYQVILHLGMKSLGPLKCARARCNCIYLFLLVELTMYLSVYDNNEEEKEKWLWLWWYWGYSPGPRYSLKNIFTFKTQQKKKSHQCQMVLHGLIGSGIAKNIFRVAFSREKWAKAKKN